jgi:hypothetical protein
VLPSAGVSRFLPTSRRLVQFSEGKSALEGSTIVYIDGAFDVFHAGHVEILRVRHCMCKPVPSLHVQAVPSLHVQAVPFGGLTWARLQHVCSTPMQQTLDLQHTTCWVAAYSPAFPHTSWLIRLAACLLACRAVSQGGG